MCADFEEMSEMGQRTDFEGDLYHPPITGIFMHSTELLDGGLPSLSVFLISALFDNDCGLISLQVREADALSSFTSRLKTCF